MIERLNAAVADAEGNTRLSRASATLMKESVAYADCYIESAKVLARDISDKTYGRVEEARDKIDGIMGSLGDISDSILELYSSMDGLKSEYNRFGDVYPAAEIEVLYPEGSPLDTAVRSGKKKADDAAADEESASESETDIDIDYSDPFPSEEDMTDFLRRMEQRYREMLAN